MRSEAARAHQALVESWRRLTAAFDDASFEQRGDLILALCPALRSLSATVPDGPALLTRPT